MSMIIVAAVFIAVVGVIAAVLLNTAAKFMAVEVDEHIAQITEVLPGANCGACGFAGCSGYAEALCSGAEDKPNLCTPGGKPVLDKVSAILGVKAGEAAHKYAVVHCRGDADVQQSKMKYTGIQTCLAAKQLFGGEGACTFGCLGYGDCKVVCQKDAICMDNGLAKINSMACAGCGLCVKACPNNLISIWEAGPAVFVICKSHEKGAVVRKKCSKGCIACGKCVRECPNQAVTLVDNLAVIDYEKCVDCGHCAEICIVKCINETKVLA